jgi:hypothetical protein
MAATSSSPTGLPICSLLSTFTKNLPPVPAVIDGLLYHGHTILSGPPKEGKSFAGLELARAVASGEPAFGCQAVQRRGRVLYLCLEDGERRVKTRMEKLVQGQQYPWLDDIDFVYGLPSGLDDPAGMAALDAQLASRPYELLVLDTHVAAFSEAATSADLFRADYKQFAQLSKLAEKHALAVLTIAHTRKLGRDEDGLSLASVAGTGGRTAAVDAVLMLRRDRKGNAKLSVTSRDTNGVNLDLMRDPVTRGWTAVAPKRASVQPPTPGEAKILDLLKVDGPLTTKQIQEKLASENASSISVWLFRLVQIRLVATDSSRPCVYRLATQQSPTP